MAPSRASFVLLRDELLEREAFDTLLEAKVVIERWRQHYNTTQPFLPPTVLFRFRKRFEMPSKGEGFSSAQCVQGYKHTFTGSNKAVILDYDGTLRETLGGARVLHVNLLRASARA